MKGVWLKAWDGLRYAKIEIIVPVGEVPVELAGERGKCVLPARKPTWRPTWNARQREPR